MFCLSVAKRIITPVLALAVLPALAGADGILQVGNVRTEESQVSVPITLLGEVPGGVASMNFQLNYDPAAVRLVSVDAGAAAQQTGKQIQWHETAPGRINIVLTGFNEQTLLSGEIAKLTVEPAQSDVRNARLHIDNSTFASKDGDVIPSQGSTGSLAFRLREQEAGNKDVSDAPPAVPPNPAPAPDQPAPALPTLPAGSGSGVSSPKPMAPAPEPEGVPESVEQRLVAARQNAESIRPLLGSSAATSDGSHGVYSSPSQGATPDTLTASAESTPFAGTQDTDTLHPDNVIGTTITPEKNLEKIEPAGHNKPSPDVVPSRSGPATKSLMGVFIGVAVIVGVLVAAKGVR